MHILMGHLIIRPTAARPPCSRPFLCVCGLVHHLGWKLRLDFNCVRVRSFLRSRVCTKPPSIDFYEYGYPSPPDGGPLPGIPGQPPVNPRAPPGNPRATPGQTPGIFGTFCPKCVWVCLV